MQLRRCVLFLSVAALMLASMSYAATEEIGLESAEPTPRQLVREKRGLLLGKALLLGGGTVLAGKALLGAGLVGVGLHKAKSFSGYGRGYYGGGNYGYGNGGWGNSHSGGGVYYSSGWSG